MMIEFNVNPKWAAIALLETLGLTNIEEAILGSDVAKPLLWFEDWRAGRIWRRFLWDRIHLCWAKKLALQSLQHLRKVDQIESHPLDSAMKHINTKTVSSFRSFKTSLRLCLDRQPHYEMFVHWEFEEECYICWSSFSNAEAFESDLMGILVEREIMYI